MVSFVRAWLLAGVGSFNVVKVATAGSSRCTERGCDGRLHRFRWRVLLGRGGGPWFRRDRSFSSVWRVATYHYGACSKKSSPEIFEVPQIMFRKTTQMFILVCIFVVVLTEILSVRLNTSAIGHAEESNNVPLEA